MIKFQEPVRPTKVELICCWTFYQLELLQLKIAHPHLIFYLRIKILKVRVTYWNHCPCPRSQYKPPPLLEVLRWWICWTVLEPAHLCLVWIIIESLHSLLCSPGFFSHRLSNAVTNGSTYPSIVAFESSSLKVTFNFSKEPGNPQTTLIEAQFLNKSPNIYSSFVFQAAVPKVIQYHYYLLPWYWCIFSPRGCNFWVETRMREILK